MYINSTVTGIRKGFNGVRVSGRSRTQDSGHVKKQSNRIPNVTTRAVGRGLVPDLSAHSPSQFPI